MTNVIFMPTWYDVTVYNVLDVFEEVKDSGLKHFGFKDLGPEESVYEELVRRCRIHGMNTYLEIVRPTLNDHLESVKMGIRLKVDHIIGGKPEFAEYTLKLLSGTGIKYWPYVGRVVGHPCKLTGTIDEIVRQAEELAEMGVDGLNVLSYRYESGKPEDLIKALKESVNIPIIATGWINTLERIRKMAELEVWGLTVGGTSILAKKLVPKGSLSDQIKAALAEVENVKNIKRRF
ncbi:MAG: hypothetical protein QXK88_07175 [Desulfurococcaceae archaeon]